MGILSHTLLTNVSSNPKIAAIVVSLFLHAFSIALALISTNFSASSKVKLPEHNKAENSPNECPAYASAFTLLILNSIVE